MNNRYITPMLALLLLAACQKEKAPNPFDGQVTNQDTVRLNVVDPEPNSIAGIYQNVFQPTCSNIGCHDGTFEPDFRTMESAYNTLVFQTPIKNDGNYSYRVHPGNPQKSAIMARLENRLKPFMPIQIEPDSDWPEKGDGYIENIRNWISAGAPDITGVIRTKPYPSPVLQGAMAKDRDSIILRENGFGTILIDRSDENTNLYFAFNHPTMDVRDFTYNKIAFSPDPERFDSASIYPLTIMGSSVSGYSLYGDPIPYTHKFDLQQATDLDSTINQWYFRVYVQDEQNPVTEIPTINGIYYIKKYMSFKWTD